MALMPEIPPRNLPRCYFGTYSSILHICNILKIRKVKKMKDLEDF